MRLIGWTLFALFVAPAMVAVALRFFAERPHWSEAEHGASGQAPPAAAHPEAVAQVYAARTWGMRGAVAVHTWIAVKPAGAARYTRYEVIGWRLAGTGSALVVSSDRSPDGHWFSNPPTLLSDVRGAAASAAIEQVERAAAEYPHRAAYRTWPGPNSNTFTAFVARRVPALRVALPHTAIGKDFLPGGAVFGPAPSGTGWQCSLFGLLGILVGAEEGIEVNVLGLVAGVRVRPPRVKLPGLPEWP